MNRSVIFNVRLNSLDIEITCSDDLPLRINIFIYLYCIVQFPYLCLNKYYTVIWSVHCMLLRLTQVEANIDLKGRRAKVLEGRLQENKDVRGFRNNSWQRLVA